MSFGVRNLSVNSSRGGSPLNGLSITVLSAGCLQHGEKIAIRDLLQLNPDNSNCHEKLKLLRVIGFRVIEVLKKKTSNT